jgi:hypothetical protein
MYGLANRLRVLLSGMVVAEATEREFAMLWPRTRACAALFDELFSVSWNVHPAEVDVCRRTPSVSQQCRQHSPGWLVNIEPHLAFQDVNWLYAGIPGFNRSELDRRAAALLAQLEPRPELRMQVEAFVAERFRPAMIGVHLRRGDFMRVRKDVAANSRAALAAVERYLDRAPDAGILLCTDDGAVDPQACCVRQEGVHSIFTSHFGARVVWRAPTSLDRGSTRAIQDALVDLWLLRQTDYLVGTKRSSFSAMAAFGRQVPAVMVGGATTDYRMLAGFGRWTGIEAILRRLAPRGRFDADTRFPVIWDAYVHVSGRTIGRMKRRLARHLSN